MELPIGAVTDDVSLIYTHVPTHPLPREMQFANHVFELDAYDCSECTLLPGYVFKEPITIHYSDADVAELDEGSLLLKYWDGVAWVDAACGECERHPDENWLAVKICHLTRFALLGRGGPSAGTRRR